METLIAHESREQEITNLYLEVFPQAARYLQRQGATEETAKELFQEATLCYLEQCYAQGSKPQATAQAYLFGIVRNCWRKHCASHREHTAIDMAELQTDGPAPSPRQMKLLAYLKESGQRCLDLLQSFYFEQLSMQQLAERFGYSSERSATVQKYKCLEKVRDTVKHKKADYEDFFN